jgi:hypothetical protein
MKRECPQALTELNHGRMIRSDFERINPVVEIQGENHLLAGPRWVVRHDWTQWLMARWRIEQFFVRVAYLLRRQLHRWVHRHAPVYWNDEKFQQTETRQVPAL